MTRTGERGFALLALFGLLGMASVGVLLAVQSFVPVTANRRALTDDRLAQAQSAARMAYRRNGAFPANLDALAAAAGLPATGAWRRDPFGRAQDLGYTRSSPSVRVRSRGLDATLNNADDVVFDVGAETQMRARQRARLRLVRAVLLRSSYRFAATMTPSDLAAMRAAMSDYAIARRSFLTATATERAALTTRMTAAGDTVAALTAAHGCPSLPARVTGTNGLFQRLGMQDSRAVDGRGRALRRDTVVGVVSFGNDLAGGTSDDM